MKRYNRAEENRRTGRADFPDLWHFGVGGTLGANLGPSLYDLADEPQAPPPGPCPGCGGPAGDVSTGHCDGCLDDRLDAAG